MSIISQPHVLSYRQWVSDPGFLLWGIAGIFWVALLAGGHQHHVLVLDRSAGSASTVALAVLVIAGAWLEMIAAMMLPTVVPMVRMFNVVSARGPRPTAARAAFLAGYLALWMVFALVAIAAATGIQTAAVLGQWTWIYTHPYLLLAAMLAIAGAFQLSSLKDRCLTQCRDPRMFLFLNYRRGIRGGWVLGLRHGLSCLGCCWALMLVMLGTGVENVMAMLVLTVVMLAEKTTRWGRRMTVPLGIALLFAAVLVAFFGDKMWGWGLYAPLYSLCTTRL